MSDFIEEQEKAHVADAILDAGYRAMAADEEREAEAREWCEVLVTDAIAASGET